MRLCSLCTMRVLQKLRNCCHCLSWSSPVLCLRICPHTTPQNRLELCAVTITRPWKLISPFRLEDSSLQDWHWALDDIDDDCSSIHFWSPHLVTLCAMCAVQCLPFKKNLKNVWPQPSQVKWLQNKARRFQQYLVQMTAPSFSSSSLFFFWPGVSL